MRAGTGPSFQLGNAPCRFPDFGKTVIWVLMQQCFGKRSSVLVVLAVEVVRLQNVVLGIENITPISDHPPPVLAINMVNRIHQILVSSCPGGNSFPRIVIIRRRR